MMLILSGFLASQGWWFQSFPKRLERGICCILSASQDSCWEVYGLWWGFLPPQSWVSFQMFFACTLCFPPRESQLPGNGPKSQRVALSPPPAAPKGCCLAPTVISQASVTLGSQGEAKAGDPTSAAPLLWQLPQQAEPSCGHGKSGWVLRPCTDGAVRSLGPVTTHDKILGYNEKGGGIGDSWCWTIRC